MFKIKTTQDTTNLDRAIDKAFADASAFPTNSEEFAQCMVIVDQLYALRYPSLKKDPKKQIDPNALITSGASIAGILLILNFERASVIGSKALGFVLKK